MTHSIVRTAVVAVAMILAVAGCGSAAPNTSDPAGTVTSAMDAAKSGGFAKLADFVCAAKKGDISTLFGGGAGSLSGLGVDANTLFDAIKIDFQDVKATETSKTGDTATVHVTGKTVTTIDPTKMKAVMKQMMTAQGLPADDATIDAALAGMSSQLTQSQTMDQDVTLKQEGGKWLICE
jgi:hypothetical protein